MARLVSPDKKSEITTGNPSEIVQLKAQGFRVLEDAPVEEKPVEDKPAAQAKPATAAKPAK